MALPAVAQEMPSSDELNAQLRIQLPSYWKINDFRTISSAQQGDPINPKALVRFEADVAPTSDLYAATGEALGPFTLIVETLEGGSKRTLYGTFTLSYSSGSWTGEPSIENPVASLGRPADTFSVPTLPIGSDRQAQIVDQFKQTVLSDAASRFSSELAKVQAEHEKQMADTRAALEAELRNLENSFKANMAAAQDQNATSLSSLNRAHAAELEQLETAQAKKVGELRAKQAEEIAELEAGFGAHISRLEAQIAGSEKIASLQNDLVAKTQTIQAQSERLATLMNENRLNRREFFESLGGIFRGSIQCYGGNTSNFPMTFIVKNVMSTGIIGVAQYNGGTEDSEWNFNIVLSDSSDDGLITQELFPMKLSIAFPRLPNVYDIVLNTEGVMHGSGENGLVECRILFGVE
jgi:hypothetical protein